MALTLVALWFTGQDGRARMRHQIGLFVALTSMGLSSLSVFIINAVYFRPRPFDTPGLDVELLFYRPTDSSFPSNSAAAAVAIAAAVWAVNRPVGIFLIAAAALYGFGRVYVGVHYPLDIAAGRGDRRCRNLPYTGTEEPPPAVAHLAGEGRPHSVPGLMEHTNRTAAPETAAVDEEITVIRGAA